MLSGITSIVSVLFVLPCHTEDTFRKLVLCGSGTCQATAAMERMFAGQVIL